MLDENDMDVENEFICHDFDGDSCDECSSGYVSETNDDGTDTDGDGWCDDGDDWADCSNDPIDADPYDECAICNGDGFASIGSFEQSAQSSPSSHQPSPSVSVPSSLVSET
jgi:hypothetical protein